MDDIRLIAGLGNPGEQYRRTRHNVGFETVDLLAEKLKVELNREKFGAAFGQATWEDKKLILLKPLLFMNNSGEVIASAANFYKLSASQLLVITDDMALEPGMVRLRASGSAGGHNGLANIIERLGTDEFARLRIGIGSKGRMESRDYVLSRPDAKDAELIDKAMADAQEAVMLWIDKGVETAMNRFNRKMSAENNNDKVDKD